MAFGAGVLVSAVAFDLFEEAVSTSANGLDVAIGFAAGAITFFVGDELLDGSSSGPGRRPTMAPARSASCSARSWTASPNRQ